MRLARLAAVVVVAGLVAVGAWVVLGRGGLVVGDCFDPPDVRGAFAEVKPLPCGEPHHAEVFFAGRYTAEGPYDETRLIDFVADRCPEAFRAYTGRDLLSDAEYDAGSWFPSEDEWAGGDRRVLCYAIRVDEGTMTGSLRSS